MLYIYIYIYMVVVNRYLVADLLYQKRKWMFWIKFNINILGYKEKKLTNQFKTVFLDNSKNSLQRPIYICICSYLRFPTINTQSIILLWRFTMSASKFAIFCIVLICLASLHECMSYIAYIPSNPLESLPLN